MSGTDTGDGISLADELEPVLSLALELPDTVGTEITDVEVAVLRHGDFDVSKVIFRSSSLSFD